MVSICRFLVCDGCKETFGWQFNDGGETIGNQRKMARESGWIIGRGYDLCSGCKAKRPGGNLK